MLWNPDVHYRIHNSPRCVPIQKQNDPVHAPYSTSGRGILILLYHLNLGLPGGLFPSNFLTKTLYAPPPYPHTCYMLLSFVLI